MYGDNFEVITRREYGHILFNPVGSSLVYSVQRSNVVLSFDFDDTLIKFKSDCEPLYSPEIMKTTINKFIEKYSKNSSIILAIFSNQSYPNKSFEEISDYFVKFLELYLNEYNHVHILFAHSHNKYRKPSPCMFRELLKYNSIKKYSRHSLYVGDAAGRAKTAKTTKDFSCSDLHFARNIRIQFQTPQEFFLGENPREMCTNPDHLALSTRNVPPPLNENIVDDIMKKYKRCVIILTGRQGSGKSTLANEIAERCDGRVHILSNDTTPSKSKFLNLVKNIIVSNESSIIIIDNTNPDVKSRGEIVNLTRNLDKSIPILSVNILMPENIAFRLRAARVLISGKYVPIIAVRIYSKKYTPPTINEGFDEVYEHSPNIVFSRYLKYEYC